MPFVVRRALRRRAVMAIAAAALAVPLRAASAQLPTSFWFFGDSFTDAGNAQLLSAATGLGNPAPSPPYYASTLPTPLPPLPVSSFSTGQSWSLLFASALGRPLDAVSYAAGGSLFNTYNFAVGGATTGATGTNGSFTGMLSQLAWQQNGLSVGALSLPVRTIDPTGLYTLFGGGNDLLTAAGLPTALARNAAVAQAVQNVTGLALGLYNQGARRFLVPFLPDLSRSPQAQALGPAYVANLAAMVTAYNQQLAAALASNLAGATILSLRLDNLFTNILAQPSVYGFTNVTTPCFPTGASGTFDCTGYLFADPLHTTAPAQQLIAQSAVNLVTRGVNVQLVPEPSSVALLAAGLVAIGIGARRRRAV